MAQYDMLLQGKAHWVKHYTTNEWGKWTMMLYPTPDSVAKIRELQGEGLMNKLSKDDDGWFVRLSRPTELKRKDGRVEGLNPPLIFDGTKPLPDGSGFMPFPDGTYVGNGSDVTVKMEVYQYSVKGSPGKKAKAMRWKSLLVENLVPYNPDVDNNAVEKDASSGFEKQPRQIPF